MTAIFGDPRDRDRYRAMLSDDAVVVDSIQGLMAYLDEHPDEESLIFDASAQMPVVVDLAERFRVERPSLSLILIRPRVEVQILTEAMRAGIREVVAADDPEGLVAAFRRAQGVARQIRHADRRPGEGTGKVMLVFSAKGGCGKTVLATNLAEALVDGGAGRVCLVDFNLEFGDVAIAMQVEPVRTISDALGMTGTLDRAGVESMVINVKPNFDVLLAPTQPADADYIKADLTSEVIRLLGELYDYVVIDSPPAFSNVILKCFDLADSYILLTTLDMLALKNFKVTLDTLDALGYPRSRWHVVLNRYDSHVGLSAQDMERTIGVPILTRLPSSKDVPASINKGVTLVAENPKHPFSRAVIELAQAEVSESGKTLGAVAAKPRSKSRFGRRGGV